MNEGGSLVTMTTVVTVAWEGAADRDYAVDQRVRVPGLDTDYEHVVRRIDISQDGATATLTIETRRPTDLARHLSLLATPKSSIRAVHHETGEVLQEGRYDFLLHEGQPVWIDADPFVVARVEHPNRTEGGVVEDGQLDVQVAHLAAQPAPTVQPAR